MSDPRLSAITDALIAETNVSQNWAGIAVGVLRAIDKADAKAGYQRVKKPIYWPGEKDDAA